MLLAKCGNVRPGNCYKSMMDKIQKKQGTVISQPNPALFRLLLIESNERDAFVLNDFSKLPAWSHGRLRLPPLTKPG